MVRVEIREDGRARLSSFHAVGHAEWAASGEDVVCAAVSTVLQTAWMGLMEVAHVEVAAERSSEALELTWPESSRDDAAVRAIVATAALAVERLAYQFPDHVAAARTPEVSRPSERVPLHEHREGAFMTDTFKPIGDGDTHVTPEYAPAPPPNEAGRTLLAGLVGGLASAVGYIVYSRLPDDQRDRLHAQVRTLAESRINEVRSRLNI